MLKAREEIEQEIWWRVQQGNSYFWMDNWTGLGALYHIIPPEFEWDPTVILVKEAAEDGQWKVDMLKEISPEDLANHILENITPPVEHKEVDRAYWKMEARGKFSVGSAFQLLRQRRDPSALYKQMWIKGLPIKISFFMWRFWKFKLPLDDRLKTWGIQFPSGCFCCQNPEIENISHVFLHATDAQIIWKHFCRPAVPAIILWEIWKRRNTLRHEGKMSNTKLIYQVMHTLISFMKVSKRNFKYAPYNWNSVVESLNRYSQPIKATTVVWRLPDKGWIKVNTDGASRGNPGRSSWGFCVRNERGDILRAQAQELVDSWSTNTQAEAMAILKALKYLDDNQMDKFIIQRTWEVPWQIFTTMEEIWNLMEGKTVVVEHIFREGNKVADHLANLALDKGDFVATNFMEMDIQGRKLVNSDKMEILYIKIRKCKQHLMIGREWRRFRGDPYIQTLWGKNIEDLFFANSVFFDAGRAGDK
ncbi:uncharacterized protein LOC132061989 [Lycium ferocissimum]|uniref:uncharacterized protein LOC132061989 n=1 Tax=Lycium ferocissimum TaxID=112874 RepID=UPI0028160851|nr:uncharacterized protein LOC132061989 [Lycium ferocissimum]